MERLPHGKYTKELRLEAVRLVTEGGLSVCPNRQFMITRS